MGYQIVNGEIKHVDYRWVMPNDNLNKSRRNLMEIPMHPQIKKPSSKNAFVKSSLIATSLLVAPVTIVSKGIFWEAFLTYIFPWMLDISKVFCAIKIAQAFYAENKGSEGGTGFSALLKYGKWYLVFWLIPVGVELIDQIGREMFDELSDTKIR